MSAPVLPFEIRSPRLADFAFGSRQHRSAAELPEPGSGAEMWWRAVALGGTGHYAAARIALRRLRASTNDPVLLSLAASTEGSFRRQLGWHARAAHDDGHAAALVLPRLPGASAPEQRCPELVDPTGPARHRRSGLLDGVDTEGVAGAGAEYLPPIDSGAVGFYRVPDLVDAAADALIGLAADALGTGRLALATRLLDRCDGLLDAALPSGSTGAGTVRGRAGSAGIDRSRTFVRLHWVRAETALAGGRADEALAAAEIALAWAERTPSIRHRVKSRLLVAAAAGVAGDTGRAAGLAALVEEQCRESGLVPLRWACAMLRTGLPASGAEPAAEHAHAAADAEACRALISRRGGRFRGSGR
ncbi:hypothetical protein HGA13_14620 [Nocardia speluncae]|uniref:Uncharacterized protein n=1 Tax=Nocardia speluncae TaxID=419477 RepID=A0A846XED0_9NOCA|nr:hypothetical protein [Nocardia speluncae]NKY34302.1 hypothetical protein [Nocardia speluncae]